MFSKRMVLIVGVIILVAVNMIWLSVNSKSPYPSSKMGRNMVSIISPFQGVVTRANKLIGDIWRHYFDLVSTAAENDRLRKELNIALEKNNRLREAELSNIRLRNLLHFQHITSASGVAAEVVGRDPSPWFKTIIINKGRADQLDKGMPVVVPQGVVGVIIDVSAYYAKVLLIIDQNSAVDAIVQSSRARGIIKGDPNGRCIFHYVLRRHEINVGDTVLTSGLDRVFPKGLRVGNVSEVIKLNAGIFQEVAVTPHVDFEKLEEVLVLQPPSSHEFTENP